MEQHRIRRRQERGRAVAICRNRIRYALQHDSLVVQEVAELSAWTLERYLEAVEADEWADVAFDPDWRFEQSWFDALSVMTAWLNESAQRIGSSSSAADALESLSFLANLWELQVDDWFAARKS